MAPQHPPLAIDTTFDFQTDARGRDPDTFSPTLRHYHKLLWSKRLPGGTYFGLDDMTPGAYLHHRSSLGEYLLGSDSMIPTYTRWKRLMPLTTQFAASENEAFRILSYTIGGMILFPGNRVDGLATINGARGCHPRIADRMDLTLECIRRYYSGDASPLYTTLNRYRAFFGLFEDFLGYVRYFLLDDLVYETCSRVKFFLPFDGFSGSPLPRTVDEYKSYRSASMAFIELRNARIERYCTSGVVGE